MNKDKTVNKSLTLKSKVVEFYEELADKKDRSFSYIVNQILTEYMEKTNQSTTEETKTTKEKDVPW